MALQNLYIERTTFSAPQTHWIDRREPNPTICLHCTVRLITMPCKHCIDRWLASIMKLIINIILIFCLPYIVYNILAIIHVAPHLPSSQHLSSTCNLKSLTTFLYHFWWRYQITAKMSKSLWSYTSSNESYTWMSFLATWASKKLTLIIAIVTHGSTIDGQSTDTATRICDLYKVSSSIHYIMIVVYNKRHWNLYTR